MRNVFWTTGLLIASLTTCFGAAASSEDAGRDAARRAAASAEAAAAEAEQAVDTLRTSTAEHCENDSAAAERIMKARQTGVAMSTVMTTATKYGEPFVGYVQAAYEMPRLSTDAAKDEAIEEFRDHAYGDCLKRWSF
ncbi:hypothetical protein [Stenotrophomonas sp.]|uniref:hypothetical protein n=1 Tax=Stenotrophomonas sp. TaxID=69392 RepID=UPI0028989531|nr:hypothetical protein [Stenotrophomonas sp.]